MTHAYLAVDPKPDQSALPAESNALFDLTEVGFAMAGKAILAGLTLTVPAQKVTALIGHNGSGKSTLIKLLARQQQRTAGTIRFAGKPLENWPERSLARKLAYLPQHLPPAAGLLVHELVAMGRYPWHGALGRFTQEDRIKVIEAMALTGTTPFANRLVDTLSGGERQRVWLAMLLAQGAECLLLDEPIAALDIAHQVEVLTLVRSLALERQVSVVVVLHDINMAARFCDNIIALRQGNIVASGPALQLMTADCLERIYAVPMKVVTIAESGRVLAYPC